DKVDEYANWKERNLAYWDLLSIAAEEPGSKLVRMESLYNTGSFFYYEEIEVVDFKEEMDREESPLSTDTVNFHYRGKLINGYVFDQTFTNEEFNLDFVFDSYKKGTVGSFVSTFSTALQYMKRGDYWKIYIPAELGYGNSGYGSIPGGSVMIFDIILEDF
ncbi:MAG: FKBP-type peptidyl-prolyl cis-trans isomerase, partial [Bacteroides sp.]|nr:FKBP-type peptidyl-prolyl cis-trans isomerase [Bacteroides sp.]